MAGNKLKPSPVWTVIYVNNQTWQCHHIEWGDKDGPPLDPELVLGWAKKNTPEGYKPHSIYGSSYADRVCVTCGKNTNYISF